jgi:thiamine monophosphate synthase
MLKFIKGLFVSEPEIPASERLVLFTPSRTSWSVKQANQLFDAGLARLHVQPVRDWDRSQYEKFLKKIPSVFWPRIVLEEHPDLVLSYGLGGFQLYQGDRVPARWPKTMPLSCKCHSYEEMQSAPKSCRYLFLSPLYPSISKKDYVPQRTPREFQVIVERWRAQGGCPVYALGGVTPKNAAQARELGFDGIAFIGSVWEQPNPVRSFLEIEHAWTGRSPRKLKRKYS